MPVIFSIALNTASTGPSPDATCCTRALAVDDERLDVRVVDVLLLVGEDLEVAEDLVDRGLVQHVAEGDEAVLQRVAAGVLAEDELALREAALLGPHDLVGLAVGEHAVLVDARLVREGVLADDRLVALDVEPR